MATSKPGNRGLHRAGWLCPARLTADVTSKDFLFFLSPRLHVCNFNRQSTVCTLKEIAPKCYLYTSVTLKQHLLEPFFFFPQSKTILWNESGVRHRWQIVSWRARLNAEDCRGWTCAAENPPDVVRYGAESSGSRDRALKHGSGLLLKLCEKNKSNPHPYIMSV